MNDTIQSLAERLAEALHGNSSTIATPHGLVILAPLPGAMPITPNAPVPAAAPAAPAEPKPEPITPSGLRELARTVAAKIGADKTRAILGKPIIEIKAAEADAIAAKLRAAL